MNKPPRGHHYISQCYLKRFTHNGSKDSQLWGFNLDTGDTFSSSLGKVGKMRDFNTIEGLALGELENRLSRFESTVSLSLDKIEGDRTLEDKGAWLDVLNLAAMFSVRSPSMRENVRQFQDKVTRKIMDQVLQSKERWESQREKMAKAKGGSVNLSLSYEQMKEFHERGEYTIKVPRNVHIANELNVLHQVIRAMSARKWSLFIASKGSGGFITSDNPVMLFHSDESADRPHLPVGHGLMGTTILFPVSRELMAIGKFEKGGDVMEIGPDDVAHFNSQVLHRAHRQIYAVNDSFQFEDWTKAGHYLHGADAPAYMRALRIRAKAEQDAQVANKAV